MDTSVGQNQDDNNNSSFENNNVSLKETALNNLDINKYDSDIEADDSVHDFPDGDLVIDENYNSDNEHDENADDSLNYSKLDTSFKTDKEIFQKEYCSKTGTNSGQSNTYNADDVVENLLCYDGESFVAVVNESGQLCDREIMRVHHSDDKVTSNATAAIGMTPIIKSLLDEKVNSRKSNSTKSRHSNAPHTPRENIPVHSSPITKPQNSNSECNAGNSLTYSEIQLMQEKYSVPQDQQTSVGNDQISSCNQIPVAANQMPAAHQTFNGYSTQPSHSAHMGWFPNQPIVIAPDLPASDIPFPSHASAGIWRPHPGSSHPNPFGFRPPFLPFHHQNMNFNNPFGNPYMYGNQVPMSHGLRNEIPTANASANVQYLPPSQPTLINCMVCDKNFRGPKDLFLHWQTSHAEQFHNQPLEIPNKKVAKKKQPPKKDNFQSIQPLVNIPCGYCNRLFPHKLSLQTHIEKIHCQLLKPHICPVCNDIFPLTVLFNRHMNKMHSKYQCENCLQFFTRNLLEYHKKTYCGQLSTIQPAHNHNYGNSSLTVSSQQQSVIDNHGNQQMEISQKVRAEIQFDKNNDFNKRLIDDRVVTISDDEDEPIDLSQEKKQKISDKSSVSQNQQSPVVTLEQVSPRTSNSQEQESPVAALEQVTKPDFGDMPPGPFTVSDVNNFAPQDVSSFHGIETVTPPQKPTRKRKVKMNNSTKSQQGSFTCKKCDPNLVFDSNSDLYHHRRKYHSNAKWYMKTKSHWAQNGYPWGCPMCHDMTSTSKSELHNHMKTHVDPYVCRFGGCKADFVYRSQSTVVTHFVECHVKHKCDYCGIVVPCLRELRNHYRNSVCHELKPRMSPSPGADFSPLGIETNVPTKVVSETDAEMSRLEYILSKSVQPLEIQPLQVQPLPVAEISPSVSDLSKTVSEILQAGPEISKLDFEKTHAEKKGEEKQCDFMEWFDLNT